MNILKNLFECYDSHDFKFFDDYLRKIIKTYIVKCTSSNSQSRKLFDNINSFKPSKIIRINKDTDLFDVLYESEEEISKSKHKMITMDTKLSLGKETSTKIKKFEIIEMSHSPTSEHFQIKNEWIKTLNKSFVLLDSKEIKRVLYMYEHPKESIRKLVLVLLQILLFKPESKIHFIEKCALGFSEGIYILTRMKYIFKLIDDQMAVFCLIKEIKKFFENNITKNMVQNKRVKGRPSFTQLILIDFFWFYQLKSNGVILLQFDPSKIFIFDSFSHFLNSQNKIDLDMICDPLKIIFGFFVQSNYYYDH